MMDSATSGKHRSTRRKLWYLLTFTAGLLTASWFLGWTGLPHRLLARRALQNREVEAAENHLIWARRLGPDSGESEFLTARVRRKQGRMEEVHRHLQRAAELGYSKALIRREDALALAQTGELDSTLPELSQMLQNPGDDGPEILEAYANGCLLTQRYDQATAALEIWERSFPNDPLPNYLRGRQYEHVDRFPAAETQYRAAVAKRGNFFGPAYRLGRLLLEGNRVDEAQRSFETGLASRHPAPFQIGVAECLVRNGKPADARPYLERAAGHSAEQLAAEYHAIGEPYEFDFAALELGRLELAAGNHEAALSWLARALERNPHDLDARYSHAVALRELGRTDAAQAEFKQVVEARQALAQVTQLRERLSEQPDDIEARRKLGTLFLDYGSAKTGVFWLRSVLSYQPDDVETHRALADYYERESAHDPQLRPLALRHRKLAGVK